MKKTSILTALVFMLCLLLLASCGGETPPPEQPAGCSHSLTHHEAAEATCGSTGNTEYWACADCGSYFADATGSTEIADKDSVTLEALPHPFEMRYDDRSHWAVYTCEHETPASSTEAHSLGEVGLCAACGYQAGTPGVEYTLKASGRSYKVTGIGSAAGHVVIASSYNGLPVNTIDPYSFKECENLTGITIPTSITSIGAGAFSGCSSLKEVHLSDLAAWFATDLESSPFSYGAKLYLNGELVVDLVIPTEVQTVPQGAFAGCRSIRSLRFEEGSQCKRLEHYAFSSCYELRTVELPVGLSYVATTAFLDCHKLVELCNLSELDVLGDLNNHLVNHVKNVYTATEGESKIFTDEEGYVFYDDGSYRCLLAYEGSATALTLPADCNGAPYVISRYAFLDQSALTSVVIPDNVDGIGADALAGCSSLASLTLPFVGDSRMDGVSVRYPLGHLFGSVAFAGGVATEQEYYVHIATQNLTKTYYIPATLRTVTVTDCALNYGAFSNCVSLARVTLGEGVTSIGHMAFKNCTNLASVVIPSGVGTIEDTAFEGCVRLFEVYDLSASLEIVAGDTANGHVGEYAKVVHTSAAAPSRTFLDGQDFLFYDGGTDARYLIGYVGSETALTLPASCNGEAYAIHAYTFEGRTELIAVTLPSELSGIGSRAFYGCSSLTAMEIPTAVTSIGDYAFYQCTNLLLLTLPATLKDIGDYAFYQCGNLHVLELPAVLERIGNCAFFGCGELTILTLPPALTDLGSSAFAQCTGLTSINFNATAMNDQASGQVTSYFASAGAAGDGITVCVGANVTRIPTALFYGQSATPPKIVSVRFEENSDCTSIGDFAFRELDRIASIELPAGLTSLGVYAFYGCGELTAIEIPAGVSAIKSGAFDCCTSLAEVTFAPNAQLVSIGDEAFWGCEALAAIEIPATVTDIGTALFGYCDNLTSITVQEGNNTYKGVGNCLIEAASGTLIAGCKNSVIPTDGSITSIGDSAFYGCTELASVVIPESVTSIGENAFEMCVSLTSLVIPSGVETIDDYAFEDCTGLIHIVLGVGVKSIGARAFRYCDNVATLYYGGTFEQWREIAYNPPSAWDEWNLRDADLYYYSAEQPTTRGQYWYYDVDGSIAVWPAVTE